MLHFDKLKKRIAAARKIKYPHKKCLYVFQYLYKYNTKS